MESSEQKNAGVKICIIDDDPFIVEMYMIKLKEQGFVVESAGDGKKGIDKVRELHPDIILLDVVMPSMDGFEVLRQIRQETLNPRPKVIFLTNFGQKEDVERGMELGADDYIIKAHFTPSEVAAKIKTLV
ncbi:MAG: response regulator [bacterium]|nr:response regulator [bacterium]MDZ4299739.1 response regulator [Candidatus Sungbacteria bacterium]